jgi:hypothetical protein
MPRVVIRPLNRYRPKRVVTPKPDPVGIWRLDGMGDLFFMGAAICRLKAKDLDRVFTLHTKPHLAEIGKYIGFDNVETTFDKSGEYGEGLDWNLALEGHEAMYLLDRVSIWEDVAGLPISSSTLTVRGPAPDRKTLRAAIGADDDKPALYFAPFSAHGIGCRSLVPAMKNRLIAALSEHYHVVAMTNLDRFMGDFSMEGCTEFVGLTVDQCMGLVAACDCCLSIDSGGAYVSALLGVPTVVIYEHVMPWLRTARIPGILAFSARLPDCSCRHHEHCPKGDLMSEPCKHDLPVDRIIEALEQAREGETGFSEDIWTGERLHRERLIISSAGPITDPLTRASIEEALAGLDWTYGPVEERPQDFIIRVANGDSVDRQAIWRVMTSGIKPRMTFEPREMPMRRGQPGP